MTLLVPGWIYTHKDTIGCHTTLLNRQENCAQSLLAEEYVLLVQYKVVLFKCVLTMRLMGWLLEGLDEDQPESRRNVGSCVVVIVGRQGNLCGVPSLQTKNHKHKGATAVEE